MRAACRFAPGDDGGLFRRLLLALTLVVLFGWAMAPGQAQTSAPAPAPTPVEKQLDSVAAGLDQIESALRREGLTDGGLQDLRSRLDPLSADNSNALDALGPQLDAAKKRVEQFGPKPGEKDPPEATEVTAQRAEQQKAFDAIDAQVKRARLNEVRLRQLADDITNRRRAILRQQLFQRGWSVVNPDLWVEVARASPGNSRAAALIASDWWSLIAERLHGARMLRFYGALLALSAAFALSRALSLRVLARSARSEQPDRLRKAASALWVAMVIAVAPVLAAMVFAELVRFFGLVTARTEPVLQTGVEIVQALALTFGLTRGLLAPNHHSWRLINVTDRQARRLGRLALFVVAILSVARILEVINDLVAAPLAMTVAVRSVSASIAALVTALTLTSLSDEDDQLDFELGPVVERGRDWFRIWRMAMWLGVGATVVAALGGWSNLASFIVAQMVWVTFVVVSAYLLLTLAREAIAAGLKPGSPIGRAAASMFGLHGAALTQFSILLSGLATVVTVVSSALLVLAPWGVESDGWVSALRAAFFGVQIGELRISLAAIVLAIGVFVLGFALTRTFQNWLDTRYLPATKLDSGLRNSITTSAGYVGVIGAIGLSLALLGLNFEKLAIVAGALSLGIGFGLQSIVSNFVSGLILLWERVVKVGDWVVVGTDQGIVRRINVRSTEIETFERQTVIVPNSNLISGVVKNWVRPDAVGRVTVPVSVSYDNDPDRVRDILLACAATHEMVLTEPGPSVSFVAFGATTMDFELNCMLRDVMTAGAVRTHLRFEIVRQFRAAGVEWPATQQDIAIANVDALANALAGGARVVAQDSAKDSAQNNAKDAAAPADSKPAPMAAPGKDV